MNLTITFDPKASIKLKHCNDENEQWCLYRASAVKMLFLFASLLHGQCLL